MLIVIIGTAFGVALILLGAPFWVGFGSIATILILFYQHVSPLNIPLYMFGGLDSFVLLCVPFFLLGGNIMGFCGPAKYLFDFVDDWMGHLPGGVAASRAARSSPVKGSEPPDVDAASVPAALGVGVLANVPVPALPPA